MPEIPPTRRIYGNRTLNLRSIRAIGYDMDYTLIHYRVDEWERRAFEHTRARLGDAGWPVDDLAFDPQSVIRGLTIDLELGNLVKPTRFGYVIKAAHGTRFLEFDRLRRDYEGTAVDLSEERWVFLNTLFSLSEASLFAQLVDLFDEGRLHGVHGYAEVYGAVRSTLDAAHMEGRLKQDILTDPDRFVVPDPDVVLALLDQKHAGKRLVLITNSEWDYTRRMMAYAFDRLARPVRRGHRLRGEAGLLHVDEAALQNRRRRARSDAPQCRGPRARCRIRWGICRSARGPPRPERRPDPVRG
jgi:HAD superfamily 5'-nucleotidase-like hydrolase